MQVHTELMSVIRTFIYYFLYYHLDVCMNICHTNWGSARPRLATQLATGQAGPPQGLEKKRASLICVSLIEKAAPKWIYYYQCTFKNNSAWGYLVCVHLSPLCLRLETRYLTKLTRSWSSSFIC